MRFNKTAIKGIAATLVLGQLNMALQPLYAAVSQDKGASSPMVRSQIERMQALQRDIDAAKARKAQESLSPADQASQRLARVEELVRDFAFLGEQPQAATNAKQQDQVRAIGPNLKARLKPLTAEQKAQRHDRRQQLTAELKGLLGQQAQDQAAVRAEFAQTRQTLQDRKLPAEILARHDAAVAKFEQRVAQFNQSASKAQQGDEQALAELQGFFDQNPTKRKAAPVDPAKLPWRTPEPTKRLPAETQTAWFQNLYANKGTRLAQVGNSLEGLEFVTPPEPGVAPTAADLAETPETQRTAAIKAKALELGNNPVNIQNWVRNNVEWVPTWGAIQSAQDTLDKKRGNAIDIASLEIALLRAAKIPARYQFGTIELPAEQVMNWVGGVTKPEAAQQLLGQGGIANRGLIEGGRISKIRMEHAWVQAYVNWLPSRGAKQGSATQHPSPQGQRNAWVPLDPSFKQYTHVKLAVSAAQTLDATALIEAAQADASVSTALGHVENINHAAIESALASYQARIDQALSSADKARAANGDFRQINRYVMTQLVGGLPYAVVEAMLQQVVPDGLRWKIELRAYQTALERAEGISTFATTFLLSEIGGKRLSARAIPATSQDAATLDELKNLPGKTLPIYLLKVKTEVAIDGVVRGTLPAQTMGADLLWGYALNGPGQDSKEENFAKEGVAGDEVVFGLNGGGVSPADLLSRFNAVAQNSSLENLHQIMQGYWARVDVSDKATAVVGESVTYRLPSVGLVAQPLSVIYSWGVPRVGSYKGYLIDVRRLWQSAASIKSAAMPVDFLIRQGYKNSYLEGRVFEEIFDYAPGNGFSAVAALQINQKAGAPVWSLSASNLDAWLGRSLLPAEDKSRIAEYVRLGYNVIASEEVANAGFWQGVGFIATDPNTGSGAYIVASGANGGEFTACEEERVPITQLVKDVVLTFIVLRLAALMAAELASGLAAGAAVAAGAAAAPVLVAAMIIVGVVALTFSTTSYAAGACGGGEKCHRGVLQAQGADIRGGTGENKGRTISENWAQPAPLTLAQGLTLLNALRAKLGPAELTARAVYFAEAESFMRTAAAAGGVCPMMRSFGPDPGIKAHQKNGTRVDINVNAGQAFTP